MEGWGPWGPCPTPSRLRSGHMGCLHVQPVSRHRPAPAAGAGAPGAALHPRPGCGACSAPARQGPAHTKPGPQESTRVHKQRHACTVTRQGTKHAARPSASMRAPAPGRVRVPRAQAQHRRSQAPMQTRRQIRCRRTRTGMLNTCTKPAATCLRFPSPQPQGCAVLAPPHAADLGKPLAGPGQGQGSPAARDLAASGALQGSGVGGSGGPGWLHAPSAVSPALGHLSGRGGPVQSPHRLPAPLLCLSVRLSRPPVSAAD